ncbi:MAG: (2Fe-2S) ferredoxin domain-containing protein [Tepidanaerobacteraceae bacterium]|nr:(2Fe-2S) ferredoxin domain-containing protein [Tepidanaerobacteraceae bacterium]
MTVNTPRAHVVLRYGICSVAAGAKDVLNTFKKEIKQKNLTDVELKLTGCIGLCSMEPLMDVSMEGLPTVTYCLVTPEKVSGIVFHHILNRTIIQEWVIPNI